MGNQADSSAGTLLNLGGVYSSLGQYDKALDCYTRARTMIEATGNLPNIANTFTHEGGVYQTLGETDKAFNCYSCALDIFEKNGKPGRYCRCLA